ncbi:hypothetical protein [Roseateles sp.]|uniref:hypothetical protein n=1 Tax=Roseateles sp. TaxID=1971397 RepID=UPI0025EBE67D|nr:hypothetical protein [Roseateles sp.]MBV8035633.1 hypothetical protein [Roseateles sp.]
MKAYAILAAIAVGTLASALATPSGLPAGWLQTGSAKTCEGRVVSAISAPSTNVFSLDCKPDTSGFSTLMQQVAGTDYAGKRVRLSAQLRADQLAAWGGLWMRADSGQRVTAFDNMQNRPLRGSFGWQQAQVVLDIPADATTLSFGFLLHGAGQLQATQFKLEAVGNDVAATGGVDAPVLPRQPKDLTPP